LECTNGNEVLLMVLLVLVPVLFLIALISAIVYFAGSDVERHVTSVKSAFTGTPDKNPGGTRISEEDTSTERSGKAGGKGVEKNALASTRDSDGEVDKDARSRGCTAWVAERVDLEGLMTKFKILLVLYQVGIPQSSSMGRTAA
jgi:hypothetical protein